MTAGGTIQTRRNEVKALTAKGYTAQAISVALGISERSVHRHRGAPAERATHKRRNPLSSNGVLCMVCNRIVSPNGNCYSTHRSTEGGSDICTNSQLPLPVLEGTPRTHSHRINQVCVLANVVQDEDPTAAWNYLTAMSAHEVQAIAMYALMAIELGRSKSELWPAWTRQVCA